MPRHQLPAVQSGRDRPATVISPSILSSDFANLASECKRMVDGGSEWLHVDVMDGHFVPNLTLGHPVVASLRKHTQAFLDVHLMVSNPRQWIQDYAKAGADMYTFHLEAAQPDTSKLSSTVPDAAVMEVCQAVKAAGMYCGIVVKPGTAAELLFPYIDAGVVDMALILTVEPGFGGQKFMHHIIGKVRTLRDRYPALTIEVDGGVALDTIQVVADAGANAIVAGTAIFGAADPPAVISKFKQVVDEAAAKKQ